MMKIASLIVLCVFAIPALAQEITVAAAADLRSALDEISAQFKAETSISVRVVYGASGNLFQQIQNGAPFDLFFSANSDYPKKLTADGLTVPDTYYEYARGHIVLLVTSNSSLDIQRGLQVLLEPSIGKIAIADPTHAPYGQAAVSALKSQGLYDKVSSKIVVGENISQAASFVTSGAADIGIVALSLALQPSARSQTRFAKISSDAYPPIQQACIVLKSSKQQSIARRFLAYVQSPKASKILQRYGFEVSSATTARPLQ